MWSDDLQIEMQVSHDVIFNAIKAVISEIGDRKVISSTRGDGFGKYDYFISKKYLARVKDKILSIDEQI